MVSVVPNNLISEDQLDVVDYDDTRITILEEPNLRRSEIWSFVGPI